MFGRGIKLLDVLPKWLLILAAIFLAMVVIFVSWYGVRAYKYRDKVWPGVYVGDLYLGGKTKEQARVLLQASVDKIANAGIDFFYKDKVFNTSGIVSAGEGLGLAYEIWAFDVETTVQRAFAWGRRKEMFIGWGKKKTASASCELNREELRRVLENYFEDYENPGRDARLSFEKEEAVAQAEEIGQAFDYDRAVDEAARNLCLISNAKIEMRLVDDHPSVSREEAEKLLPQAKETLTRLPWRLFFEKPEDYTGRVIVEETEWQIDSDKMKEWLKIKSRVGMEPVGLFMGGSAREKEIYLGVDEEKVSEYLAQVATIVDAPAKDARFEVKDGRVTEWQSAEDGWRLNIPETINLIENDFIREEKNEVKLVLSAERSKISNDNVNDLGIRELVGAGESDFSGSPVNRRHNIGVGVDSLDGLLIMPDEEFSLLRALGEIDAEAGYLPELVIKEGRTVSEYGGGLCQIGTTLFRTVINTGLPVTERRNHSYRVSYYEPAGTDATIYNPWPDMKFVNDTGNYLLLQTRVEGNKAIFEFWGTSDGRKVETTEPVIYNIQAPGDPRMIETDELEPGEKRKVESAHNGADAYFDRMIEWPGSSEREKIEERFSSHYVPWKEAWLVGRKSTSTEENLVEEPSL